jgi:DNA-binding MarR family transcriptional regulator
MTPPHLPNRLGALALGLSDAQEAAAMAASGLGPTACAALLAVGVAPGASIGEVAPVAGVSHSVMVRATDALAAAGLVTRAVGADRRRVALRLTPAGEATRAAILAARAAALEAALAPLTERERAALDGLLGSLLAGLTTGRTQADHLCRLCDEDACGDDCPVEREARRIEGASA